MTCALHKSTQLRFLSICVLSIANFGGCFWRPFGIGQPLACRAAAGRIRAVTSQSSNQRGRCGVDGRWMFLHGLGLRQPKGHSGMRAMKQLSKLVLIATLVPFAMTSTAQVSDKMLFQFCSPFPFMELQVFIQETGEPRFLTEESIRSPVERTMRQSRIFAGKDAPPVVPVLRVAAIKHNEAFSTSISHLRHLRGILEDRWMRTSVWNITRVGTAYSEQRILASIADELETFLSEFSFTQNSPECHAWKLEMK